MGDSQSRNLVIEAINDFLMTIIQNNFHVHTLFLYTNDHMYHRSNTYYYYNAMSDCGIFVYFIKSIDEYKLTKMM